MQKSDSIKELATALAKAQGEIENASKNSNNPHFKSKYADLAEVLNTVRPVFAKHGISVIQAPSYDAGIASVETMLAHISGEWMANTCSAPVSKQDAQGVGSAITYLRRYSLAAFAGIAQEDDDGNSAVGHSSRQQQQSAQQRQQKAALPSPWETITKAVRDGKRTAQYVRDHYLLSVDQDNELDAIEKEMQQ